MFSSISSRPLRFSGSPCWWTYASSSAKLVSPRHDLLADAAAIRGVARLDKGVECAVVDEALGQG